MGGARQDKVKKMSRMPFWLRRRREREKRQTADGIVFGLDEINDYRDYLIEEVEPLKGHFSERVAQVIADLLQDEKENLNVLKGVASITLVLPPEDELPNIPVCFVTKAGQFINFNAMSAEVSENTPEQITRNRLVEEQQKDDGYYNALTQWKEVYRLENVDVDEKAADTETVKNSKQQKKSKLDTLKQNLPLVARIEIQKTDGSVEWIDIKKPDAYRARFLYSLYAERLNTLRPNALTQKEFDEWITHIVELRQELLNGMRTAFLSATTQEALNQKIAPFYNLASESYWFPYRDTEHDLYFCLADSADHFKKLIYDFDSNNSDYQKGAGFESTRTVLNALQKMQSQDADFDCFSFRAVSNVVESISAISSELIKTRKTRVSIEHEPDLADFRALLSRFIQTDKAVNTDELLPWHIKLFQLYLAEHPGLDRRALLDDVQWLNQNVERSIGGSSFRFTTCLAALEEAIQKPLNSPSRVSESAQFVLDEKHESLDEQSQPALDEKAIPALANQSPIFDENDLADFKQQIEKGFTDLLTHGPLNSVSFQGSFSRLWDSHAKMTGVPGENDAAWALNLVRANKLIARLQAEKSYTGIKEVFIEAFKELALVDVKKEAVFTRYQESEKEKVETEESAQVHFEKSYLNVLHSVLHQYVSYLNAKAEQNCEEIPGYLCALISSSGKFQKELGDQFAKIRNQPDHSGTSFYDTLNAALKSESVQDSFDYYYTFEDYFSDIAPLLKQINPERFDAFNDAKTFFERFIIAREIILSYDVFHNGDVASPDTIYTLGSALDQRFALPMSEDFGFEKGAAAPKLICLFDSADQVAGYCNEFEVVNGAPDNIAVARQQNRSYHRQTYSGSAIHMPTYEEYFARVNTLLADLDAVNFEKFTRAETFYEKFIIARHIILTAKHVDQQVATQPFTLGAKRGEGKEIALFSKAEDVASCFSSENLSSDLIQQAHSQDIQYEAKTSANHFDGWWSAFSEAKNPTARAHWGALKDYLVEDLGLSPDVVISILLGKTYEQYQRQMSIWKNARSKNVEQAIKIVRDFNKYESGEITRDQLLFSIQLHTAEAERKSLRRSRLHDRMFRAAAAVDKPVQQPLHETKENSRAVSQALDAKHADEKQAFEPQAGMFRMEPFDEKAIAKFNRSLSYECGERGNKEKLGVETGSRLLEQGIVARHRSDPQRSVDSQAVPDFMESIEATIICRLESCSSFNEVLLSVLRTLKQLSEEMTVKFEGSDLVLLDLVAGALVKARHSKKLENSASLIWEVLGSALKPSSRSQNTDILSAVEEQVQAISKGDMAGNIFRNNYTHQAFFNDIAPLLQSVNQEVFGKFCSAKTFFEKFILARAILFSAENDNMTAEDTIYTVRSALSQSFSLPLVLDPQQENGDKLITLQSAAKTVSNICGENTVWDVSSDRYIPAPTVEQIKVADGQDYESAWLLVGRSSDPALQVYKKAIQIYLTMDLGLSAQLVHAFFAEEYKNEVGFWQKSRTKNIELAGRAIQDFRRYQKGELTQSQFLFRMNLIENQARQRSIGRSRLAKRLFTAACEAGEPVIKQPEHPANCAASLFYQKAQAVGDAAAPVSRKRSTSVSSDEGGFGSVTPPNHPASPDQPAGKAGSDPEQIVTVVFGGRPE